mgnify:CR=1 FL=1
MKFKTLLKKLPIFSGIAQKLNNLNSRIDFVAHQLSLIPDGCKVLDAGCGSQQFKIYANHLQYFGQDFGGYHSDDKPVLGSDPGGLGGAAGYDYGKIDYLGDIWEIDEEDNTFDCILCTEVFEHIPYPIETVKEFSRLLKPGGTLILTSPSNCLRHMDPYFYYTGFTDRWFEVILKEHDFDLIQCEPVGDYFSWLAVEMARSGMFGGYLAKLLLAPAFLYFYCKKKTQLSVDTLCMGYHVVAKKK